MNPAEEDAYRWQRRYVLTVTLAFVIAVPVLIWFFT
jgi:hypothetical protein